MRYNEIIDEDFLWKIALEEGFPEEVIAEAVEIARESNRMLQNDIDSLLIMPPVENKRSEK